MKTSQRTVLALYVICAIMTSSLLDACSIQHDVRASVRHVESTTGNDIMNMSVHFREIAIFKLRTGKWTFLRHFPQTQAIQTDLASLKISTRNGHSIPWIEKKSSSDQIRAVSFTLDGSPDDVTVDVEFGASIISGSNMEEECSRLFHYFIYPITGNECVSKTKFGVSPLTYGVECYMKFSSPAVHSNVTPVYTTVSEQPQIAQISLKCFGGRTCTCACSTEVTEFCRLHLTDTVVRSLLPEANQYPFGMMIVPFILAVITKLIYHLFFQKTKIGDYMNMVFDCLLVFSISSVLFFSLIIPVHMDAAIRACSTVFESQGGYFFPLLFWTYFPYVITLLITTGFIDNADLVVSVNGNLKVVFFVYQFLSPLMQVWLFFYRLVVPLNCALLLTASICGLSGLRLYFRNPFRNEHV